MPGKENEVKKNRLSELHKLGDDLGYIDYLIEQKYIGKVRKALTAAVGLITIITLALGAFGINSIIDIVKFKSEAEEANKNIQEIYADYMEEKLLSSEKQENSKFYAYYLQIDNSYESYWRPRINNRFEKSGFYFADTEIEERINVLLYRNGFIGNNMALTYVVNNKDHYVDKNLIAVIYSKLPENIINRIDSIFNQEYIDCDIKYFEDSSLPGRGFFYYIF